uniref:Carbohydrate sulfotransferase n=1 Tax=Octopus bimaculoides TaxID=37653 RepID=A0A0L8GKK9_OCTBM
MYGRAIDTVGGGYEADRRNRVICTWGFWKMDKLMEKEMTEKFKILFGSEFQQRNKLLEETCKKYYFEDVKYIRPLIMYHPLNLSYCKVPKVASSYWMRFFSALGDTTSRINAFDRIRFKVHRMHLANVSQTSGFNNIKNKLIVTRNPFTRLFSAYVDKIFLSENWQRYGRLIIKDYRDRASSYSLKCGNDVQFHEFLQFVTAKRNDNSNRHWNPITVICNPCGIKYNFIIKLESFAKDRDNFIRQIGIKRDNILKYNNLSHKDYTIHAIRDLAATSILHFRNKSPKVCYKERILFSKLFSAFQIQGYIHREAVFNVEDFSDARISDPESIISVYIKIYNNNPLTSRKEWEDQRKMYFVKAYQNITFEILKKIKKMYYLDFRLFDYNLEPERIDNL